MSRGIKFALLVLILALLAIGVYAAPRDSVDSDDDMTRADLSELDDQSDSDLPESESVQTVGHGFGWGGYGYGSYGYPRFGYGYGYPSYRYGRFGYGGYPRFGGWYGRGRLGYGGGRRWW